MFGRFLHPSIVMANLGSWFVLVMLVVALVVVEATHSESGMDEACCVEETEWSGPRPTIEGWFANHAAFHSEFWLDCALSVGTTVTLLAFSLQGLRRQEGQPNESEPVVKSVEAPLDGFRARVRADARTFRARAGSVPSTPRCPCCKATAAAVEAFRETLPESWPFDDTSSTRCRLVIGIDPRSDFKVVRRIIGKGGRNIKEITDKTPSARIRIRGKGSGFTEGNSDTETDEPLMICLRAGSPADFRAALASVEELMDWVYHDFITYHHYNGLPEPHDLGLLRF